MTAISRRPRPPRLAGPIAGAVFLTVAGVLSALLLAIVHIATVLP